MKKKASKDDQLIRCTYEPCREWVYLQEYAGIDNKLRIPMHYLRRGHDVLCPRTFKTPTERLTAFELRIADVRGQPLRNGIKRDRPDPKPKPISEKEARIMTRILSQMCRDMCPGSILPDL